LTWAQFDVPLGKAAEGRRSPKCWRDFQQRLNYAKRLGVRQSSGALSVDKLSTGFSHGLLYAVTNKMNALFSQKSVSIRVIRG
jgi:hypothetical protein